jgi:hypothetical protein
MAQQYRKPADRPRHPELDPLRIGQYRSDRYPPPAPIYRHPSTPSPLTPYSTTSLTSPILHAVRQYHKENGISTDSQENETLRRNSVPMLHNFRRRQLSISSPNGLTARFGRVAVTSPLRSGRMSSLRAQPIFHSLAEESRKQLLDGVRGGDLATLSKVVVRRSSCIEPSLLPQSGQISYDYAHAHLQRWGHAYLGSVSTADAFVKAVHLRSAGDKSSKSPAAKESRSSGEPDPSKEGARPTEQSEDVVIRARVTPKAKERKPFLLQRRFNIEELRVTIPSSVSATKVANTGDIKSEDMRETSVSLTLPSHLRSKSIPTEDPSEPVAGNDPRASSFGRSLSSSARRVMPIRKSV